MHLHRRERAVVHTRHIHIQAHLRANSHGGEHIHSCARIARSVHSFTVESQSRGCLNTFKISSSLLPFSTCTRQTDSGTRTGGEKTSRGCIGRIQAAGRTGRTALDSMNTRVRRLTNAADCATRQAHAHKSCGCRGRRDGAWGNASGRVCMSVYTGHDVRVSGHGRHSVCLRCVSAYLMPEFPPCGERQGHKNVLYRSWAFRQPPLCPAVV